MTHIKHKHSGQVEQAIPETTRSMHDPLVLSVRATIAALCQNATHSADIDAAITSLQWGLKQTYNQEG